MVLEVNTQAPSNVTDCSDRNNSKYYIVVVQASRYTARFSADIVKNFLYSLNNGKIPKKKFNLRLAPEETSLKLTGFGHNAVTCIGMNTDIPVILDEAITKLNPDFFWLGGGEFYHLIAPNDSLVNCREKNEDVSILDGNLANNTVKPGK
ncbi:hypothetical protein ACSBR2_015876 [Camellia fascicularis]